jgi:fermentation-respiration switch protein FrsA (DUF1100 family)
MGARRRLIAPRPLLIANGAEDPRCPAEGVSLAVGIAREEYRAQGAADELLELHFEPQSGHAVTEGMWAKVDAFFIRHLSVAAVREKAEL